MITILLLDYQNKDSFRFILKIFPHFHRRCLQRTHTCFCCTSYILLVLPDCTSVCSTKPTKNMNLYEHTQTMPGFFRNMRKGMRDTLLMTCLMNRKIFHKVLEKIEFIERY